MNRISILLFLSAISASLLVKVVRSAALEGEQIQGGDDTKLGECTYQISLQVRNVSFCGGSIIDETHVVTAAHCVVDPINRFVNVPLDVVAGINNIFVESNTYVKVQVEKVYVPVEYNATNLLVRTVGDIAVLKLKEPLDLDSNPNLSKVELPEDDENKYNGTKAVVTGFGVNWVQLGVDPTTNAMFEYNHMVLGNMRVAKTDVINNDECQKYYRRKPVTSTHVCAFVEKRTPEDPQGVCAGDSGGPLVHNNVLIGTVSNSPLGCREDNSPAVYTRVSSYLEFIKKAVKDEGDSRIRTQILPLSPYFLPLNAISMI